MMKHNIGIMQGRLTESKGRGIQFFPFDNWEKEFYLAAECGLNEIEFIFDYENYENNPLWSDAGIAQIKNLMEETGVIVRAICFDYFMRRPFFKSNIMKEIETENTKFINRVLLAMDKLKIELLEIPLVDDSSLKDDLEKELFRHWLKEIMKNAPNSIKFGLETDLPPKEFRRYILSFGEAKLGANYDSGNSSGLGYDLYEEVTTLRDLIFNIHIKDRVFQGTTVQLGTGSADFDALFKGLSEIQYPYSFILQAARGQDGKECENIMGQMMFVNDYIKRYGI